jgi:peptide/nickel transport system permease protein
MLPESTSSNRGFGAAKYLSELLLKLIFTLLLGGFLGATLVRFAPGFNSDEESLDSRLSEESKQAIRQSRAQDLSVSRFYFYYLAAVMHGDLGTSRTLARPVSELLRERLPVTMKAVGTGWVAGWCLGLALAISSVMLRSAAYDSLASLLAGLTLCFPVAVVALLFMYVEGPASLVISLIIFPKIFQFSRSLLKTSSQQLHILAARAKGAGRIRVLVWHILPTAAPQLLALAGVTMSIALGSAIPVEAIFDLPGTGQLAWQSALSRDLPVLVNLTLLMTGFTLLINTTAEVSALPFKAGR